MLSRESERKKLLLVFYLSCVGVKRIGLNYVILGIFVLCWLSDDFFYCIFKCYKQFSFVIYGLGYPGMQHSGLYHPG